ncbi:MAG: TlpA family protein disulfide reductase [Flavobacteriales bacterium]|jgi:thiol-disulfide isomerase/thioredoxin|nr:TlpA family protein disulfide reductase [Flavobacteriales bacterium]MBT6013318.1 TlpA family protein disulfide reductase [Flavobacteriales bacterium]MBT7480948.1 TlpA family protein disulfide reductase [Flavobacteriales bacterium]
MKENINNLTALLIVISIATLSYLNINKEKVEIDVKVTKQIVEKEIEIETEETVVAKIPTISQVVISGKITWPINREARFFTRDTSITTYVDWIGKFNLTFPLDSSGYLTFHHGMETTAMYYNPDDTIHITINTKKFDETIAYTDSEESNFLAWKYLYQENSNFSPDVYNSTVEELSASFDSFFNPMIAELERINMNNTKFYDAELAWMNQAREYYLKRHEQVQNVPKAGESAIDFTYPDIDSNMVSLSDFKGSYVYVDIWATWCGPCKYEIPFLIQLEKDYHDANIIFMSVSVDVEKAKQKWIDMINEKDMGGVQLISTDGWQSQIMKDYAINSIPRFMLFDPDGNVISVNAVRPSSEEIREIFNGFGNIEEEVVDL